MDNTASNKRIAKNTLFLYFRMILTMTISLYTSRIVLQVLGVTDYGIYNVVGGVVTMFAFLNGAMVTSTQRYITYYLGIGDYTKQCDVFTTCVQIHAVISLIVVLLAETAGLWFLYTQMVIPASRFIASLWVFHLSVATMVVQIMSVPYNSAIIAHEQMGAFAYISILEVTLKLLIVYLLTIGSMDKLVLYAILTAVIQFFIRYIYTNYCLSHFSECKLRRTWNFPLFKEIGSFAGWNLWGNLAGTLMGQGLNLLLNVFFGPVVNAARGIAQQVEMALTQFSSNFLMAVNPQITKTYARSEHENMHRLIFRACKFSYFLLFLLSLPIMLEAETILRIWLKTPPENTAIFLRLALAIVLVDTLARPLMTAAAATGKVKLYQSVVGGILLLIVPTAYVVLKLGGSPASVYVVHFFVVGIAFIARLFIIRPMISLCLAEYFRKTILPVCCVTLITLPFPLLLKAMLSANTTTSFAVMVACMASAGIATFCVGLNYNERIFVTEKISSILAKMKTSGGNGKN